MMMPFRALRAWSTVGLLGACTTLSNITEEFIDPIDERLGDPDAPAAGTIEARLVALETAVGVGGTGGLIEDVASLASRVDAAETSVQSALTLASEAALVAGESTAFEVWGRGAYPTRTLLRSGVAQWTLPLNAPPSFVDPPIAFDISYWDCDLILVQVEFQSSGSDAGVDLSMAADGTNPLSIRETGPGTSGIPARGTAQVWVPTQRGQQFWARTLLGVVPQTTAQFHHVGCARTGSD
jgi:hypothetical protein